MIRIGLALSVTAEIYFSKGNTSEEALPLETLLKLSGISYGLWHTVRHVATHYSGMST